MIRRAWLPFLRPTRLLLKIFLWFWAAMTVSGVVLLALETVRAERMNKRWRGVTSDAFAFYATSIAKDHEDQPDWAAREFLTNLHKRTGIRAWLFDARTHEVSNYAPQAWSAQSKWMRGQMRQLMENSKSSSTTEFLPLGELTLAAHTAGAPSGQRYTLIGTLPATRYGPWQAMPQIQALRLVSVLAAAGLVSWLLSRQLTAPIEGLRAATRRLAHGDLAARAGGEVGGRRDELAQLARDFDRMAERIENLLLEQEHLVGAQRRLVRDVSHELRSPLARLGVALELARDAVKERLDDSPDSRALSDPLDRIEREAGRLGAMLDRLLILARLDSGVQAPEAVSIDLAALVRAVVADADFEARPLKRAIAVTECDNCITSGTRDLLRSAIENVVRNAIRHTPEATTIEVSLRQEKPWAVIEVKDQGPGVPETELSEIFRPFYRASSSRDRQSGGTGLGLAITERAVSLHGGSVKATNAPEGGFVVQLSLPLTQN